MHLDYHYMILILNYRETDRQYECRLCGEEEESTEHIFLECKTLAEVREGIKVNSEMLESEEELENLKEEELLAAGEDDEDGDDEGEDEDEGGHHWLRSGHCH